jgi:drug/metabolite transporter (DMT)-like permease
VTWLLLSIFTAAANFLWFKLYERWQVNTLVAVAANYPLCVALAWLTGDVDLGSFAFSHPWLPAAIIIGFLYVALFVLIGQSAQTLGVNITAVASKMSFVIPMAAAHLYLDIPYTATEALALLLALAAIYWQSAVQPNHTASKALSWLLPLLIFLGGGLADSLLQFTESKQLPVYQQSLFIMTLFGTAGFFGWSAVGLQLMQKQLSIKTKDLLAGALLGLTNFTTVFALLRAFGSGLPAAYVFPMLNVGIILLTALAAALLFGEKPKGKQWWGLAAALLAIAFYASDL